MIDASNVKSEDILIVNTIYFQGASLEDLDKPNGKIRQILEKVKPNSIKEVIAYEKGVLVQINDKDLAELCVLLGKKKRISLVCL